MWDDVKKRVQYEVSRARNAVLGIISSVIPEEEEVFIKTSEDDELRDVKVIAPYGICSLPPIGMFGEVIFNNTGKKAYLVGVEDRDAKKVQIQPGEILIYNKIGGNFIHLKNDGSIDIKGKIINLNGGS